MKRFALIIATLAITLFFSVQTSQARWGHRRHVRHAHRHVQHYYVQPRRVHVPVAPVVVAPVVVAPSYHTYGVRTHYRSAYPVHGTFFYQPGSVSYGLFY